MVLPNGMARVRGANFGSGDATRLARVLAIGLVLGGCGGAGGGDDSVDAAAGGDGSSVADSGGATDGAGSGDGANGGDDRLYPVEVGRSWTYQVAAVGAGAVCSPGSYSEVITGQESVGGRTAFAVDNWCSAVGTTYASVDGDLVETWYNGGWITALDTPVEEGHTWNMTSAVSYTWHDAGTVTVPAGTFDDCWNREQNVSYTAYTIYCRGVGVVRSYSQDLGGNGWDAQLATKSF